MGNRREFVKKTASAAAFSLFADWANAMPASDSLGEILPQRQLTRDGQKVTSFIYFVHNLKSPSQVSSVGSKPSGFRFHVSGLGYWV